MIIHPPRHSERNGHIYLGAKIDAHDDRLSGASELWFRVAPQWQAALANSADPFLAGLLPVACELGEDIEIAGPVSPRLVHNAREYVRILNAHDPARQHLIELRVAPEHLVAAESKVAHRAVGMGFSGGVDAQYLLWSHLPAQEPLAQFRVSHVMTVNGFDLDIDLQEQGRIPALQAIYASQLQPSGVEHIVLATNLRSFRQPVLRNMVQSYATSLTACALALSPLFGTFYIASSYKYATYGTIDDLRPMLDPLLSNETTAICHGGAEATRFERLQTIAEWPATYDRLRVCSNPDHTNVDAHNQRVNNCGRCEKCVLTQLALMLMGRADRYSSCFPEPLTTRRIVATPLSEGGKIRVKEYHAIARRLGQRQLAADLQKLYWRATLLRLAWYLRKPRRLFRRR